MRMGPLKGGQPEGLAAVGLPASMRVSSSPWSRRPLVARSSMSAIPCRLCEIRSQREGGRGLEQPSGRYRRAASHRDVIKWRLFSIVMTVAQKRVRKGDGCGFNVGVVYCTIRGRHT